MLLTKYHACLFSSSNVQCHHTVVLSGTRIGVEEDQLTVILMVFDAVHRMKISFRVNELVSIRNKYIISHTKLCIIMKDQELPNCRLLHLRELFEFHFLSYPLEHTLLELP